MKRITILEKPFYWHSIADACEELHDDAYENIDDIDELQKYLDTWCDKQSGTTTYYPCYRMYVEVTKDLFLT